MDALARIAVRNARRLLIKAYMMDLVEFARGIRGAVGGAGVGVAITLAWHFLLS